MRIERVVPARTGLAGAWARGEAAATPFYPPSTDDPGAVRALARSLGQVWTGEKRARLAGSLRGGGAESASRLERFVREGGFVVTTGQQPVLFGGPLYVLYKALGAIHLAARWEVLLGRPVLPVFWIASEDHDWEEARLARIIDPANELHEIRVEDTLEDRHPPLFRRKVGRGLRAAFDAFAVHLPDSEFAPRWERILDEAASAGTLPEAFEAVILGLLGDRGLFTLQAHDPGLKEATRDLLVRELDEGAASEQALVRRAAEIEGAGFACQVPILDGALNLFVEGPTGRERLFRGGDPEGGFVLRRSGAVRSLEEIAAAVRGDPAILSPNVLLRPVVEAAFIPTLAYVAGPGEAAYLAQSAPLFERHGVHRPLVHLRDGFNLVEAKIEKVLAKLDLTSDALSEPFHELAGQVVREGMPEGIRRALGEARGALARSAGTLAGEVRALDPTLEPVARQLQGQGFQQLDEIEKKVVQSLKRENEITLDQLRKAQLHLHPGGEPQERAIGPWYHLYRYGAELIDRIATELR